MSSNGNNEYIDGKLYAATKLITAVDFRSKNIESFENLEKNSIDFYASVRSLYLQDRENKINNSQRGNLEIIYNDDDDWGEIQND